MSLNHSDIWAPTALPIAPAMLLGLDGASAPPFPHVVSSTAELPLTQDLAVAEEVGCNWTP